MPAVTPVGEWLVDGWCLWIRCYHTSFIAPKVSVKKQVCQCCYVHNCPLGWVLALWYLKLARELKEKWWRVVKIFFATVTGWALAVLSQVRLCSQNFNHKHIYAASRLFWTWIFYRRSCKEDLSLQDGLLQCDLWLHCAHPPFHRLDKYKLCSYCTIMCSDFSPSLTWPFHQAVGSTYYRESPKE